VPTGDVPSQPDRDTALRVVSHGGGVQTTAMLVLAAQGRIDYQTFLFANVGDDSEDPLTLRYLREIAKPYARRWNIGIYEIARPGDTLYQRLLSPRRSVDIPVRMANGAPGNRNCTAEYKIKVVGRWLKDRGATAENKATVAVGISKDEIHRASNRKIAPYETIEYPLLDLRMNRADCAGLIQSAGLPLPPKSACWFCPFHKASQWAEMRRDREPLFIAAAGLEAQLIRKRATLGKDPVYLTQAGVPLGEAIGSAQDTLWTDDDAHCDNGWCMT